VHPVEPRIKARAPGRRALVVVAVLAFSHDTLFGYVFLSSMNHYLLDVLHAGAGLPAFAIGLTGVAAVLVQPLAGFILDRATPRTFLLGIVATEAAGLVLILSLANAAGFLAGAGLVAVGISAIWPLAFAVLRKTQPEDSRAFAALVLTVAGFAGTSFGLAAGIAVSSVLGWQPTFFIAAVPIGVSALTLLSPVLSDRSRSEVPEEVPPAMNHVVLLGCLILVNHAAVASLLGLYGPFFRRTLGVSLGAGVMLLLPAGGVALLSLAATSRRSTKNRRMTEIAVLFVVAAVGALLVALSPSPLIAAIAAPLLLAGLASVEPVLNAAIIDAGGGATPGRTFGALLTFQQAGVIVGPAAVGLVSQVSTPRWGLAGTALVLSVGAAIAFSRRSAR
jgi:predicted MFS family arabinose efflux permease